MGRETMELRQAIIPVISRERCRKIITTKLPHSKTKVTDNNICAGYEHGRKDACQGDSGGPMIVNKRLAGVVSRGIGCGRDGIPGIYTSVPKFWNWIHERMIDLMEK